MLTLQNYVPRGKKCKTWRSEHAKSIHFHLSFFELIRINEIAKEHLQTAARETSVGLEKERINKQQQDYRPREFKKGEGGSGCSTPTQITAGSTAASLLGLLMRRSGSWQGLNQPVAFMYRVGLTGDGISRFALIIRLKKLINLTYWVLVKRDGLFRGYW
jgi:hypothetical protein